MENKETAFTVALKTANNQTPGFLADATSSLEKMEAYAGLLIKSGLVPKHFYQLDQFRNPVKDAQGAFVGNTAAVIMTIQHGFEVGMSISQALQQIVPINGLMSIKGDGAKALIMNSGLCSKWEEVEVGESGSVNFGVKISAARKDGQTLSRTFTVSDAVRSGLWITDEMVKANSGLTKSAWYKFGPRMLRYRCLGFIARDLFADVLQGMYTEEEARDVHEDNTTFKTEDGMTVKLNDERGKNLNTAASAAVKNKAKGEDIPPVKPAKETVQHPASPKAEEKAPAQVEYKQDGGDNGIMDVEFEEEYQVSKTYTVDELKNKGGKELLEILNAKLGVNASEVLFVGENKPKKVVGWIGKLILAHQNGTVQGILQKDFNYSWGPPQVQSEGGIVNGTASTDGNSVYRVGDILIGEPGDGRTLDQMMKISDYVKKNKLDKAKIMEYVEVQCLGYGKLEDFYREGSASDIVKALTQE